jgi:glycosyltransferase involved in cell wall biosynthesis
MKIALIIPTFNRGYCLSSTIQSVLQQTYFNWTLIIIDDGSTDNTKEVVASFNEARITYVYQENAERSAARNKGIAHTEAEWLCFLDSDDVLLPEHLHVLASFIENQKPSPGLIATGLITQQGQIIKKKAFLALQKNVLEEIGSNFLIPTQVCVHRSVLEKDQFDVRFRLWEDTHLWLRIAAQYPVYQIEEYTAIQNLHEHGTVFQGMKKIRLKDVVQYVSAIQDLRDKHTALFEGKLPQHYFNRYIDSKYRMYLYQARQNKQFLVASQIWINAWQHRPSMYVLMELPKIMLNRFNIGLHAR